MFCPKCGSKVEEGALFCGSCGAKLIKSEAAEQVQGTQTIRENVKRSIVESSSVLYKKAPNIKDPVILSGAKSASMNATELHTLLEAEVGTCPEIKSIKPSISMNEVILRSRINDYRVSIKNGQAQIRSQLGIPLGLLYAVLGGLICFLSSSIGWDMMEGSIYWEDYAIAFALFLFTGGLITSLPLFIGHEEKAAIIEYVRGSMEPEGITLTSKEMKLIVRVVISIALISMSVLFFIFGVSN